MSAAEVIEQIKTMPVEEKARVVAYLRECESDLLGANIGNTSAKEAGEWVIRNYGDLLQKLAK